MERQQNEEVWELLRSIQKKMRDHLYQTYKKHGISVQEALLIRELSYYPGINLNDLSGRLGLSKSTVSSMITRLEEQGVVMRTIPEHNRRTIQLSVSPAYLKRPEVMALKDELVDGILKNTEGVDFTEILEGLRKLDGLMTWRTDA